MLIHQQLSSLPDAALPQERALIERIAQVGGVARGTLLNQLAGFAQGDNILKPKSVKKFTNLRSLPSYVYGLLLAFAQRTWPDLTIADDFNCDPKVITFAAEQSARKLPFISKGGARYGSVADNRTDADRIACADFEDSRTPCRMLYHFELCVGDRTPIVCSIVERLQADGNIPAFPWSM